MLAQFGVGWQKASPRSREGYRNNAAGLSAVCLLLFHHWVKGMMRPPCAPSPTDSRTVYPPWTLPCLQSQHPLAHFVRTGNTLCPRAEPKDMNSPSFLTLLNCFLNERFILGFMLLILCFCCYGAFLDSLKRVYMLLYFASSNLKLHLPLLPH